MQADQKVLSLRPGGGGNRGSRLIAPRFGSSGPGAGAGGCGFSSDVQLLRPHGTDPAASFKAGDEGHQRVQYTRDQLLQLRPVIDAREDMLKIKEEIAVELFAEDQSWGRGDANQQGQSQSRYAEPDNRDWRGGRSRQLPAYGEERSWENIRDNRDFSKRSVSESLNSRQEANQFNRQDQLGSQMSRVQISSSQGAGDEGHQRVQYTRDQLLQLRPVIDAREDMLKIKEEIAVELFAEDQSWGRGDANGQSQSRYAEPDNRDWRGGRSRQLPAYGEERSWENIRDDRDFSNQSVSESRNSRQEANQFNRQDQLGSQMSRVQISSSQGGGPDPALIKADVPWYARRSNLSEKECVLKTVKGISNKLTPKKFDLRKGQLIDSGITTPDILKGAVLQPTFCPMYALPCEKPTNKESHYHLNGELQIIPLDTFLTGLPVDQIASKIFLPNMHFSPKAASLTLSFYEAILEQTNSALFTHNTKDGEVAFSKLKILHILSPQEWQDNWSKTRMVQSLNQKQRPYNYWDYMNAWEYILLRQNSKHSHSWLISFQGAWDIQIPEWFWINWWSLYGPPSSLLPESLSSHFKNFATNKTSFKSSEPSYIFLVYSITHGIPWILKWDYNKTSNPPFLFRRIFVKRWDKFDVQRVLQNQLSLSASNIQQFPPLRQADPYKSFKEAFTEVIKNPAVGPFKTAPIATSNCNSQDFLNSQEYHIHALHKEMKSLRKLLSRLRETGQSAAASINEDSGATQSPGDEVF